MFERAKLMHYLRDPIVLVLLTLVSAGALKWAGRTIVESIANARRVKVISCECGRLVHFYPPLKLPTKAELYALGGDVVAAMNAAEGVPNLHPSVPGSVTLVGPAPGGRIVLEDIPPAELSDGLEPCSKAKPCSFCVHGRVLCVVCKADLGCALRPNPLRCSACVASGSIPDAELVVELPRR